jgi:hypothetical protein
MASAFLASLTLTGVGGGVASCFALLLHEANANNAAGANQYIYLFFIVVIIRCWFVFLIAPKSAM